MNAVMKTISMAVLLLCMTSHALFAEGTIWGINWWPRTQNYYDLWGDTGVEVLHDLHWTVENKARAQSEIDQMASMGTEVVRLWIPSHHTGFGFGCTQWDPDRSIVDNLPEMVGMLKERGIKSIIAFWNLDLVNNTWTNECGGDFNLFLQRSVDLWINPMVEAVEDSPYADNVLYYDYHNELFFGTSSEPDIKAAKAEYARYVYDHVSAPAGKRGFSVLWAGTEGGYFNGDLESLADALGAGRPLDFVDFHVYPHQNLNTNIASINSDAKGFFPSAQIMVGEFGRPTDEAPDYPGQAEQLNVCTNIMNDIEAENIPYALNWLYFDSGDTDVTHTVNFGLGIDEDNPKHFMGYWADRIASVPNADMELGTVEDLQSWFVGGSVNPNERMYGPASDAASGDYYGRVFHDSGATSGNMWIASTWVETGNKGKLYANAFIRGSGIENCYIVIKQYNAVSQQIGDLYGPTFTPVEWRWYNYRHAVKDQTSDMAFHLNPDTRRVLVMVYADVVASPAYLDIDTVSAFPVNGTAMIVSLSAFSSNIMKIAINVPGSLSSYYPIGNTNLVNGTWAGVAHSDNGSNPFIMTNLSYSTSEGTNEIIYVQAAEAEKFFNIDGG